MKEILKCRDCKQIFEIDSEKPVGEQIGSNHTWLEGCTHILRHKNHDDYLDEKYEEEVERFERRCAEEL